MSGLLSKFPAPFNNGVVVSGLVIGAIFAYTAYQTYSKPQGGHHHHHHKRHSGKKGISQTTLHSLPRLDTDGEYTRVGVRRESIAGESVKDEELQETAETQFPKKAEEVRKSIGDKIANLLLFRNLDRKQKDSVVDAMQERKVTKGEVIIKQGDEGDYYYLVDSGVFEIFVDDKKVAECKSGQGFGELALLYSLPRAATVTAITESVVWSVDRKTFRRLVLGSNARKRQQYQRFLKEVPILRTLNEEEILKAADALATVSFKSGEAIINEGDYGDTFYIIEEGTVSIRSKKEERELSKKNRGDYFGEIALLTDGLRVASVIAESDVDCLVLDKQAFDRLLGRCVDILKRNMEVYQRYESQLDEEEDDE